MPELGKCRSCGKPIIWVTMVASGKKNPLDSLPTPKGNVVLVPEGNGDTARVLNAEELKAAQAKEANYLYLSHFATCSQAKQHRKPRNT